MNSVNFAAPDAPAAPQPQRRCGGPRREVEVEVGAAILLLALVVVGTAQACRGATGQA